VLADVSQSKRSQQLRAIELRCQCWAARFEAKSTHLTLQNLGRMSMEHREGVTGVPDTCVCMDNVGAALFAGMECMWNSRLNALALQYSITQLVVGDLSPV
jgi:hypothetical protein